MTEKPIAERTFFFPYMILGGSSEHMTRFLTVANLEDAKGRNIFETLSSWIPAPDKLAAIDALSKSLDVITRPQTSNDAGRELASQYFLAAKLRYYYFAVEDTEAVSEKMGGVILKLFTISKPFRDATITDQKRTLIQNFRDLARQDYGEYHPGSDHVPNRRAEALLEKLRDIDPSLFP